MKKQYQTVVITGASAGIGEGLAREYGGRCNHIVLVARRQDRLEAIAASLSGCKVHVVAADVSDTGPYIQRLSEVLAPLPAPDLVVLNAGIGQGASVRKPQTELFLKTFGVNLLGAVATLDAVLPGMIEAGRGHIAGIASVAAYRGLPGTAAYCSSKSAMWRALESMRCNLSAYGITVGTIHPGFIDTDMTRVNEFRMPFLMDCPTAIIKISRAIDKGRVHYAFPWQYKFLFIWLKLLPDALFFRIFRKKTRK